MNGWDARILPTVTLCGHCGAKVKLASSQWFWIDSLRPSLGVEQFADCRCGAQVVAAYIGAEPPRRWLQDA